MSWVGVALIVEKNMSSTSQPERRSLGIQHHPPPQNTSEGPNYSGGEKKKKTSITWRHFYTEWQFLWWGVINDSKRGLHACFLQQPEITWVQTRRITPPLRWSKRPLCYKCSTKVRMLCNTDRKWSMAMESKAGGGGGAHPGRCPPQPFECPCRRPGHLLGSGTSGRTSCR